MMWSLSELKQTRFYQEVKQEGKLESIPRLLRLGLSVEQIAQGLDLPVELVQKTVTQLQSKSNSSELNDDSQSS
ncbi:MAG: hypothetical protein SWJ54_17155 [Cyanobacteriota bacterium]|nr:hypothetical protein [Cyanobacteriota bacterium]